VDLKSHRLKSQPWRFCPSKKSLQIKTPPL
jgi:hypothetical protein